MVTSRWRFRQAGPAPAPRWPGAQRHVPARVDTTPCYEVDFAAVVEHSSDITVAIDAEGAIHYASGATGGILSRHPGSLAGRPLAGLVHPDDRVVLSRLLDQLAGGEVHPMAELRLSHVNGSWIGFEATVSAQPGAAPARLRLLNLRNISERNRQVEELRELALHDPLTLLANRALFRDHVRHALAHLRRTPVQHAVLFLDLDDFKTINDSLGHAAGDKVLVTVADRLRSRVRPNDVIARLGGDEFAILVENTSERDAVQLAKRILDSLQLPLDVHGKLVVLSGSAGIALSEFAIDDEQFMRNADVAMYRAKAAGKGRYAIFKPEMHLAAMNRLDLEADLRRAIEGEELFVQYQPIVDLRTGAIAEVEVLVRWRHFERGLIRPDEFIPVAEESGLIRKLGLQVLRRACEQGKAWHDAFPDRAPLGICVNASVRQIESDEFFDEVAACLEATGLHPRSLTLEITESVFMYEFEATLEKIRRLKTLGVKLAIDDFGTGYSSLTYLRLLPIDVLKIDKSFVDGVTAGPEQSAVARAVVKLARTFDLRTVAEGIELPEQVAELISIGADLGQGYFFAKPLDAAGVDKILSDPLPLTVGSRG